jgi:hypothetical protein
MQDFLPADPKARRQALILFGILAVAGTVAVWWMSSYLDTLTTLAQTDREASLHLFRTRIVPALGIVVLVAVLSGAMLARQGVVIVRTGQFPPPDTVVIRETRPHFGGPARMIGTLLVVTGALMAIVPLLLLAFVLWSLRGS